MMSTKNEAKFVTYTGRSVDILNPSASDISLEDIARALSRSQRFAGHAHRPISIAEHSVMVSKLCTPAHAILGLLHDASEAYCEDIVSSLKKLISIEYRPIEQRWARAIGQHFEIDLVNLPEDIHLADQIALQLERRDCFVPSRVSANGPFPPTNYRYECLEAHPAYMQFIQRFLTITQASWMERAA